MKELRAIVEHYRRADKMRAAALATVVKVRGSSYRSPGARMLITDDGRWAGSISGGCLEGDALRKARQVMADGKPVRVTYDTHEESNQNLGIGLGCHGIIDVVIERVAGEENAVTEFEKWINTRVPVAMATICSGTRLATRFYFREGESAYPDLEKQAQQALATGRSEMVSVVLNGQPEEVFMEVIEPAISLVIFGAGFDARPVSALAKSLGWHVQVTDECAAHIAPLFFPAADNLLLCHRTFVDRDFDITPFTACVLMSHNYEYDRDVLQKLLATPTPYIGILGPRKRFDKMLAHFAQTGVVLTDSDHHRIHSPIGLDIGAESPDEIALSIASEIHCKFRQRSGGFLKYRSTPIHERADASSEIFKQIFVQGASQKHRAG
jgi:xanthine/CO dehydrogenase XdhC/CoxF family maturation factor